jgi:HD-like signal output (HDOD) protein
MPIFGRTVQEVISVSEDDDASASQLGQVVLKDAAMTSRVLKLANSSYYNPGRQHFSTISRAIMMLGFDTVRSMCLTVALIDSLVQGIHREHLVKEMARSLHAASQAQLIAKQRGDSNPEEVFISTLLFHIGDLAFWCFAGEEGEALDAAMRSPGIKPEQAQRQVLGFSLQELSEGLAREWSLSELLQETLESPAKAGERGRAIVLSHELAKAAEQGWETEAVKKLTKEMAEVAGLGEAAMTDRLHNTAKLAVETSAYYGAKAVSEVIPLPARFAPEKIDDAEPAAKEHPDADPGLQLKILRELTGLMTGPADFNMVVEMILEGIHRGVGMDRALFALLSPDRKELRPKFVLGDPDDQLREAFKMHMGSDAAAPVRHVLATERVLWAHLNSPAEVKQHITDAFSWITGTESMLLAPISLRGKPIGVFYADRAPSKRKLDQECYDSFNHFTQQASLVLNHLADRR